MLRRTLSTGFRSGNIVVIEEYKGASRGIIYVEIYCSLCKSSKTISKPYLFEKLKYKNHCGCVQSPKGTSRIPILGKTIRNLLVLQESYFSKRKRWFVLVFCLKCKKSKWMTKAHCINVNRANNCGCDSIRSTGTLLTKVRCGYKVYPGYYSKKG